MQSIDQILDPKYQPWGNTGPRKAYYQVCDAWIKKKKEKKTNSLIRHIHIMSLSHTPRHVSSVYVRNVSHICFSLLRAVACFSVLGAMCTV